MNNQSNSANQDDDLCPKYKDGIIVVPPTTVSSESSEGVPAWVKNNAGWWADGTISDGEFVNGIKHLIKTGLISVSSNAESTQMVSEKPKSDDSKLAALEAELEKCSESLSIDLMFGRRHRSYTVGTPGKCQSDP